MCVLITSAEEVMFSVALVCLQDNSKSNEWILIKFAGESNWLDFGDVLADTDEMRILAHAPATAPLGGGLRSPSASSFFVTWALLVFNPIMDIMKAVFKLYLT